jgi:very-short-patch-repair endonuclease
MMKKLQQLKLFISSQDFTILREQTVQGGYQITVSNGSDICHCTLYNNGNVLIQGSEGGFKKLLQVWAGKASLSRNMSGGYGDLPSGWREWNEDASWLTSYISKHGIPSEDDVPDKYKIFRERMFHDYMFRNKQSSIISYKTLTFVLENWMKRFCFMNLDFDSLMKDVIKHTKGYLEDNDISTNIAIAANAVSQAISEHCQYKFTREGKCPQTKEVEDGCVLDIVDALYPYSEAGEIIAYTQGNLSKLIKYSYDLKWYPLKPQTPIEESMAEGLKSAGLLYVPQFQAFDDEHRYKIDFVIKTSKGPRIAIECDGLQYHATPINYQRDRIRDRHLQKKGFYIMRFASVEIFNNLSACIEEIDRNFWSIQKGKLTLKDKPRSNYFGVGE